MDEIFISKKPLIVNDMQKYDKWIKNMPPPLPLTSFLGLPLVISTELMGIIGLANHGGGYNEKVIQQLSPLFPLAARIVGDIKMVRERKLVIEKERKIHKEQAKSQKLALVELKAANEAKSAFVAHMSHELRTPLTGIINLLGIVNKEALSSEDRDNIEMAEKSAQSLLSIANDILDMSKIEANSFKLEEKAFDVRPIVHEVIRLLSFEAQKKDTEIRMEITSSVPDCLVGDPIRLRQILLNLVGNAIKFTEKGNVSIIIDGFLAPDQKDNFIISGIVKDTGIGMKPELLHRLFKPFSQCDESLMRKFGGTGLGLFITKQLCEKMGGEINVSSEVGRGSTFNFKVGLHLPVITEPTHQVPTPSQNVMPASLSPNLRILIAEDNEVNQKVLKSLINRAGCSSITMVSNGREAVNACKQGVYDVVLMDGEMPEMDGFEATRQIRQTFDASVLPIIGITAHGLNHREIFLNSGMNGYLTKPVKKENLVNEILRCLQK